MTNNIGYERSLLLANFRVILNWPHSFENGSKSIFPKLLSLFHVALSIEKISHLVSVLHFCQGVNIGFVIPELMVNSVILLNDVFEGSFPVLCQASVLAINLEHMFLVLPELCQVFSLFSQMQHSLRCVSLYETYDLFRRCCLRLQMRVQC